MSEGFCPGFSVGMVLSGMLFAACEFIAAKNQRDADYESEYEASLDKIIAEMDAPHPRNPDGRPHDIKPMPLPGQLNNINNHRAKRARQAIKKERVAMLKLLVLGKR